MTRSDFSASVQNFLPFLFRTLRLSMLRWACIAFVHAINKSCDLFLTEDYYPFLHLNCSTYYSKLILPQCKQEKVLSKLTEGVLFLWASFELNGL